MEKAVIWRNDFLESTINCKKILEEHNYLEKSIGKVIKVKICVVILQYLTFELVLGQAHGSNRSYSFVSNELPPCLLFLSFLRDHIII